MCMHPVPNYSSLAATRHFLGLAEASIVSGDNYYPSCWYKRCEFEIHTAIFLSAAAFAGSFGGLLAAAIALIKSVGGKPGWAWIFILDRLFTVVVGVPGYWMAHDFPDGTRFLKEDKRARAIMTLKEDKQHSSEHENFRTTYASQSLRVL